MRKFLTILWAMFIPYLTASAQDEMTDTLGQADSEIASATPRSKVASASLAELDVNGDGVLNAGDIVDIVRFTRGNARAVFQKSKADVNGDGEVNLEDAKLLSVALTGGELPSTSTRPTENTSVMRGDSVINPAGPQ
jgi:hypothetical protein